MPQLDLFFFLPTLIYLFLVFFLLLFFMQYAFLPKLAAILKMRQMEVRLIPSSDSYHNYKGGEKGGKLISIRPKGPLFAASLFDPLLELSIKEE